MNQRPTQSFGDVTVYCLVTGPIEENAYLIRHSSGDAVLVDPGDDAPDILGLVRATASNVRAILLTHAHFDHIGAVQEARVALNAPVHLHADAWTPYSRAYLSAERFNLPFTKPEPPDHELEPGVIACGALSFLALFTPGHAPGHLAFYHQSGFVISGDALFRGTVGRTDIPGADTALLLERIKTQLYTLPDDTVVFPGHGANTTIGAEKRSNPHTQG
jgi:glyoxylase-like metal-dependent hydrolase (beta-lactamase superfamily II)